MELATVSVAICAYTKVPKALEGTAKLSWKKECVSVMNQDFIRMENSELELRT